MTPLRRSGPLLAAFLLAAPAALAAPRPGAADPPQSSASNYSDGTGDSAVDSLNASQLDNNYRGPRYQVQHGTNRPLDGSAPPPAVPLYRPPVAVAPRAAAYPPPPPLPASGAPSAIYPAGPPG
ncbi:MAG: hypothetical protein INR65_04700 [Gluconacetobacter diazotrophicus]|nr:hypothetical protein [Gluconacetobacter diazotrophicus]